MTEQAFITERVDGQIAWYNKKAGTNKVYHYWIRSAIIILSASIPVLSLVDFHITSKDLLIGLLGAVVAVLAGLSSLMGFQDKWTEYRVASENLIHEKMIYLTKTAFYKTHPEPFDLFVSRIEEILNTERTTWSVYTSTI